MKKSKRRPNEFRTSRLKSGLTLEEVAYLLGIRCASEVFRFENSQRLPPLRVAMAYRVVFAKPIEESFGDLYQREDWNVRNRAAELLEALGNDPFEGKTRQKCHFLADLIRSRQPSSRGRR